MKKLRFTILLAVCILLLAVSSAWNQLPKTNNQVTKHYFLNFDIFENEVEALQQLTKTTENEAHIPALQHQLTQTRISYKKIEFIFDYFETTYNYFNVNGGPLPKLNKEIAFSEMIPPNGLQTLDELIFSDNPLAEITTIRALAADLEIAINKIALSHKANRISQCHILEAARSGLVRVFTLGVTGFDTPGSGNGLPESDTTMRAIENLLAKLPIQENKKAVKSFEKITKYFQKSHEQFNTQTDFETFDRMAFLMEVINPLYKELRQFQHLVIGEGKREKTHAQNYQADNLFDADFLSRDFYSMLAYNPLDNPAAVNLGKLLFFDPVLSVDLKLSCSSCHHPDKAFTDGLPKSVTRQPGVYTLRNAPTVIDAGFASKYFWDLREINLERQVAHVVADSKEFNIDFNLIARRLNNSPEYLALFKDVYGDISKKTINSRSISNAIAAYVNSLVSFNSPFDKYVRGEKKRYSKEAKRGFNLFMGKAACATCHFPPAFNGLVPPFYEETESEVLGITIGMDSLNPILDTDSGRQQNGIKNEDRSAYYQSFKTVTVRNAELTAPYMHNGSFKTLDEVLEFYDHGGGAGLGLDVANQTLAPDRLMLTTTEKQALITFMKTLSDTTGLTTVPRRLPLIKGLDRTEFSALDD